MKKSLLLLPLTMAFLCGCKESSSIQTYQPPINVETSVVNEESAVKKTTKASSKTSTKTNKTTTTTTTSAPKNNTSTIKDLIIDGNGNLVATKSNNTFAIIGNVQGEKGAKGDTGERGAQGEKGQDGRGIDHCELDTDKNLIIHYTDGTSQNVGCVAVAETPKHDYEQVGYEPQCKTTLPFQLNSNSHGYAIVNTTKVTLIEVNDSIPSRKYKYKLEYCGEHLDDIFFRYATHSLYLNLDVVVTEQITIKDWHCTNNAEPAEQITFEAYFYTQVPCTSYTVSGIWG